MIDIQKAKRNINLAAVLGFIVGGAALGALIAFVAWPAIFGLAGATILGHTLTAGGLLASHGWLAGTGLASFLGGSVATAIAGIAGGILTGGAIGRTAAVQTGKYYQHAIAQERQTMMQAHMGNGMGVGLSAQGRSPMDMNNPYYKEGHVASQDKREAAKAAAPGITVGG